MSFQPFPEVTGRNVQVAGERRGIKRLEIFLRLYQRSKSKSYSAVVTTGLYGLGPHSQPGTTKKERKLNMLRHPAYRYKGR